MAIARGLSDDEFIRRFFQTYPDFLRSDTPGGPVSQGAINELETSDRRNPQFRRLLAQGRLLPTGPAPEEASPSESLLGNIEAIANTSLARAEPGIPERDRQFLDSRRSELQSFLDNLSPVSPDPRLRQMALEQAQGDFGRLLSQSTDAAIGDLNRRGLIPTRTQGASTPAETVLSQIRASVFEDPLTRFIREFDINAENQRIAEEQAIRQLRAQGADRLLSSGESIASLLAQLDASNLNSQRGFVGGLAQSQLSAALQEAQLDFQREQFERNAALEAEVIAQQERQMRRQNSGNLLGTLLPIGLGALTGGLGGAFGLLGSATAGQGALFGALGGIGTAGSAIGRGFADRAFQPKAVSRGVGSSFPTIPSSFDVNRSFRSIDTDLGGLFNNRFQALPRLGG